MVLPVTPAEAVKRSELGVPEEVIAIWNRLICENLKDDGTATILACEIAHEILKVTDEEYSEADGIEGQLWRVNVLHLSVADVFSRYGWKVRTEPERWFGEPYASWHFTPNPVDPGSF